MNYFRDSLFEFNRKIYASMMSNIPRPDAINIFLLVSQSLLAFLILDYFLIDDCFQCTDDEKIHFICRLQSANHVLEILKEILILEILKYRMEGNPFVSGMGPLQRHVSQRYDNWFSQKCETVYIWAKISKSGKRRKSFFCNNFFKIVQKLIL